MGILLSEEDAEFACHVELLLKFMEKSMHNLPVLISVHMSLKQIFFVEDFSHFNQWLCNMSISCIFCMFHLPVK